MKSYIVRLHEDKGDKFQMFFECWAEDEDHAEEQTLNAYPCGEVVHISQPFDTDSKGRTLKETIGETG